MFSISLGVDALVGGVDEAELRRSTWTLEAIRALLARVGLRVVSDDDLLTLARQLPIPIHHRRSLQSGRVAVALAAR